MTPLLWALVVAAGGWSAAALMLGLWLGERARRRATERLVQFGIFDGPQAARLPDRPDAEQRAMTVGRHAEANRRFSEETIRRGSEALLAEARAEGRSLSAKDARDQAIAMLYGGFETDADLPAGDL